MSGNLFNGKLEMAIVVSLASGIILTTLKPPQIPLFAESNVIYSLTVLTSGLAIFTLWFLIYFLIKIFYEIKNFVKKTEGLKENLTSYFFTLLFFSPIIIAFIYRIYVPASRNNQPECENIFGYEERNECYQEEEDLYRYDRP